MKHVAIVGSGISGLGVAESLKGLCRVTLFESGSHFGGHANTVDVTLGGVSHGVDTGFLVYNERTYPELIALFKRLDVKVAPSEMSFSVQAPAQGLEWSGTNLDSLFAQRRNLLRPGFWAMLWDILRFNRLTTTIAERGTEHELGESIGDFLQRHRFGLPFREGYLLPMIGCIWSCPTEQMLRFPISTLIRFCHNHGLLQVSNRPQWYTVSGGSRQYVRRIVAGLDDARLNCPVRRVQRAEGGHGVWVHTDQGAERFDDVVLACHSDQALALLESPTDTESELLGALRYQRNEAVLHTDVSMLPRLRRAWAAWNYERAAQPDREQARVCLHYLINLLQPLPWTQPVIVSLNPLREPAAASVIARIDYAHPVFDVAAVRAQQRLDEIQGGGGVWFCGAWTRYGFHEDGLRSGLAVSRALRRRWQGEPQPVQAEAA